MEQKLSALIVDDEANARKLLEMLLRETLYFSEIKVASSCNEALDELSLTDPDLIFIEIGMPGTDGFNFLDQIPTGKSKPAIVVVTAFENFAIQSIKKGVFDYILKPVTIAEIEECVSRYTERRRVEIANEKQTVSARHRELIPRVRVNTRTGTIYINPATILYCKAEGNYTTICTGTKQLLCSMNLGKVEELLPGAGFIRIGRSHIVNFEYITMIDRKECQVTLIRENESAVVKLPRHLLRELDIL
jgi:two-component system, LytTR family, response regulator